MVFDHRLFELVAQKRKFRGQAVPFALVALEAVYRFPLTWWILTPLEVTISVILNLPIPIYKELVEMVIIHFPGSPGMLGNYVRAVYYRTKLKSMGTNAIIEEGVRILNPGGLELGEFVLIDKYVMIAVESARIGKRSHVGVGAKFLGSGSVEIGDYGGIGINSILITSTELPKGGMRMSGTMVPFEHRNVKVADVVVKREGFVGTSAILMPGVVVEEGGVIGAGVIAFKGTQPWEMKFGRIPENLVSKSRDQVVLEDL